MRRAGGGGEEEGEEEESETGRKRSGTQCGTERHHWDHAMRHPEMRGWKLKVRTCYAIWDLRSCQCPGGRRKGFDYSSLIILSCAIGQECT